MSLPSSTPPAVPKAKGDDAQRKDVEGLTVEEGVCTGGAADREAEEDGDDIHQLIAGGLADPLHNAGLLHQVAEHQHTDQRRSAGSSSEITMVHMIGKMTFSVLETGRSWVILTLRSFLVVSARMMGGWMTGTSAI